jgi:hypothetical protein
MFGILLASPLELCEGALAGVHPPRNGLPCV